MTFCNIMWHLVTSCDILWHLVTSCDILWHIVTSCDILWHLVTSCDILWHLVTSCDILWHLVTTKWKLLMKIFAYLEVHDYKNINLWWICSYDVSRVVWLFFRHFKKPEFLYRQFEVVVGRKRTVFSDRATKFKFSN